MLTKKSNDKDIFSNVIGIGLRMYGNGYPYPSHTIDYVTEYCRQQLRHYFLKHNQLTLLNPARLSLLSTLIYSSRHKKSRLKRLQQFVQAKDRPTVQQEELVDNILKDKKVTIGDRFSRICRQMQISLDDNEKQVSNNFMVDLEKS